jgi:hypothetical protein
MFIFIPRVGTQHLVGRVPFSGGRQNLISRIRENAVKLL